jgi:hypothetical protein
MLRKSIIVGLAATAVAAATALMATEASAGGRGGVGNVPSPGTWNYPPYSSSFGGMPGTNCGYVRVRPYKSAKQQYVYQCH